MNRIASTVAAASRRRPSRWHLTAGTTRRCLIVLLATCIPAIANNDLPKNIRVIVEYIEAPHELVTEVMLSQHADSGPKLHTRMREFIREHKARVLETSILTSRAGGKGVVQSNMEHISPTEYEFDGPPHSIPSAIAEGTSTFFFPPPLRPEIPTAFETRNVGVALEIEPTLTQQRNIVSLRFAPQIVNLLRYETWVEHHDHWGDGSVRRPTYESFWIGSSMILENHKFGFVGVLTPRNPDGGRDTTRKILLFVRADIMTIGA